MPDTNQAAPNASTSYLSPARTGPNGRPAGFDPAGAIIILARPWSGLVMPRLMVNTDMLFHGPCWDVLGITLPRERPAFSTTHQARA